MIVMLINASPIGCGVCPNLLLTELFGAHFGTFQAARAALATAPAATAMRSR